MLLPLPLFSLLLAGLLLLPIPPYAGVVVDARTNKPVAGVSVRSTGRPDSTTTNESGQFQLARPAAGLDFSHPCYAPLHTSVPTLLAGPDTLRLVATSYVLDPVTLRAPKRRGAPRRTAR